MCTRQEDISLLVMKNGAVPLLSNQPGLPIPDDNGCAHILPFGSGDDAFDEVVTTSYEFLDVWRRC